MQNARQFASRREALSHFTLYWLAITHKVLTNAGQYKQEQQEQFYVLNVSGKSMIRDVKHHVTEFANVLVALLGYSSYPAVRTKLTTLFHGNCVQKVPKIRTSAPVHTVSFSGWESPQHMLSNNMVL